MSLISYLNTDAFGSSSVSAQVTQAMQAIAASKAATTPAQTNGATNGSSVFITADARRAVAEKDDAGKTAAALATELRASLDAAYAKTGENKADLTALSGRALATVALNAAGQFSPSEIAAAKAELRERDRQSILAEFSAGPLTAASLAAYTQKMLNARAAMSAEELSLREASPNLR